MPILPPTPGNLVETVDELTVESNVAGPTPGNLLKAVDDLATALGVVLPTAGNLIETVGALVTAANGGGSPSPSALIQLSGPGPMSEGTDLWSAVIDASTPQVSILGFFLDSNGDVGAVMISAMGVLQSVTDYTTFGYTLELLAGALGVASIADGDLFKIEDDNSYTFLVSNGISYAYHSVTQTAPDPPTGVGSDVIDWGDVQLSWTADTVNALKPFTGIHVYVDGDLFQELVGTGFSASFFGSADGQLHYGVVLMRHDLFIDPGSVPNDVGLFRIDRDLDHTFAVSAYGSFGESAIVAAGTVTVPAAVAPIGIDVSNLTVGPGGVYWRIGSEVALDEHGNDAAPAPITGYRVYADSDVLLGTVLASDPNPPGHGYPDANGTPFVVDLVAHGLNPAVAHTYGVQEYGLGGESAIVYMTGTAGPF